MTKSSLVVASLIADALDLFVVGQVPVLSWFIDVPVLFMHVAYAGTKGLWTLVELVPVVGALPLFSVAAVAAKPK